MANSAQTPAATKFQQILASSGQEVLDQRALLLFKGTSAAIQDKLTGLNRKKDALELEILNLTDLSVETRDSLRPGDKNYNPTAWVDKLCDLRMQLELLEDEISVVEAVQEEYFTVIAPTAKDA